MKHFRLLSTVFLFAVCSVFLLISTNHVSAVTCVNPNNNGAASAWANGVSIAVTVSGFSSALEPCVKTAFDNWNAAAASNGSSVAFTVSVGTPITTTGKIDVYQVTSSSNDPSGNPMSSAGSTGGQTNGTNRVNANTSINPQITNCTALTQTTAHEIGHTFGLGECSMCTAPQQSVMIGLPCGQKDSQGNCIAPDYNNTTYGLPGPTSCDNSTVNTNYPPPPSPPGGTCANGGSGAACCVYIGGERECISPIIIDTNGKGFSLTSPQNGVMFNFSGSQPIQTAWTAAGSGNAFLCLPGLNGRCDDGADLFGNFTPQPPSDHPNGFLALAVYDLPAHGGNGNGVIDAGDAIFSSLRLWIDANHDGISQPEELFTLPSLGVNSISLSYHLSERTDQYGNLFRYVGTVDPNDSDPTHVGKKVYDVFFATLPPATTKNLLPRATPASKCPIPVPAKGGMLPATGRL